MNREQQQRSANQDHFAEYAIPALMDSSATWEPVAHVPTGLRAFDRAAGGGLRVGGVHLLVGSPACGKTTVATQIALNAALLGTPVGVFSLEQGREEIARLVVGQLTGIPRSVLDAGVPPGREQEIARAKARLAGSSLRVFDDHLWTAFNREDLTIMIERLRPTYGWRLVVLDYLGLLAPNERDGSSFESDLRNSAALKDLARKHGLAVLAVGALRKPAMQRADRPEEPGLSEVLGAGRLGYDATSVWRVDAFQSAAESHLKLTALKSRFSGAANTGESVRLSWRPECGYVGDWQENTAALTAERLTVMQPRYAKGLKRATTPASPAAA
jgi:replicative DNA helicase